MKRLEANQDWTLMDPNECPGLCDVYGLEFETLYCKYESEKKGRVTMPAQRLWKAILVSQIETGTPYLLYKDACNQKSNQKNLGTIRGGNLCTEIIQYSSSEEVSVCNLASVSLSRMVNQKEKSFDLKRLHAVVKVVARALDKVIDRTEYPVAAAKTSNLRHRPMGIGVQGLADAFLKLGYAFESDEAADLNRRIFETMYHGALEASSEMASEKGAYESYEGSPASKGLLQFDMWEGETSFSGLYDWPALKARIAQTGLRNCLLIAPMPTASTSQILGNNEGFEPYTSNIYSRRVLSGEFVVMNPHLLSQLVELGLWDEEMKQSLIAAGGSVQNIANIPESLKPLYKTVWEIKQRTILNLAADRGRFIDQSQSMNVYMGAPTVPKLTSMHFHAWKLGLKTGCYYLRAQPAASPIQVTVDPAVAKKTQEGTTETPVLTPLTTNIPTSGETDSIGATNSRLAAKPPLPGNGVETPQTSSVVSGADKRRGSGAAGLKQARRRSVTTELEKNT
eukprot:Filipodium_phascolosomae@DN7248_c0_g1_i1.p1